MIERSFIKGDAASVAQYSQCETYRYSLIRTWGDAHARVLFIMLNPSTATERQNDPTVERCERRSRVMGYGSFAVCNIFALRSTDPRALYRHTDPVGPRNDDVIVDQARNAACVICAWGTHGALFDRHNQVKDRLKQEGVPMQHLGLSKHGFPKHPLYISYQQQPVEWL